MRKGKRIISIVTTCFMVAGLGYFGPLPANAASATYYVSTSGSDSNNGQSKDKPFKSIDKAIEKAEAGTTIYLMGGTFKSSKTFKLDENGNSGSPIKILNYDGQKPVVDFSSQPYKDSSRGFQISGNYWYIEGLTIQNAGDNGIYISGDNNQVKDCFITKCGDTGLQMSKGASNNRITKVTSTYNYDSKTDGENADGFAAKLSIGPGNVFENCTALHNSDDGFDFYSAGNAVKVYNSEASYNGKNSGNGQGFKVGGNYTADNHYLEGCTAIGNRARGFDQNNNTGAITLKDCTGIDNNVNFNFPKAPSSGKHFFSGCISKGGKNKDKIKGAKVVDCSFNE
ncbi:right-handed parallel beta-helix repeat-containing protein [Lacrimispora sp. JR3]|uniref:right-handed parallel beta-helix repeat-containing protein n=1 Tax=Lacrimispora sinapis TaxID=3111456 RepID=UPI003748EC09